MITGLNGQGPGDIVGAVAGETEIAPHAIGNIDIKDSRAFVEVKDGQEQKLVEQLNGRSVGRSEVTVTTISDKELTKVSAIHRYADHFNRLVEQEREEEMREHEESILRLSGKQREEEGKAILHLRGRNEGKALEGQLVKFMRHHKGEPLPDTEISVGDLVMISRKDPLRDDNPTGTVVAKTNYSVTAAFDNPQSFIFGKGLRMDLYVNDITYQRMKEAINTLRDVEEGRLSALRDILAGLKEPAPSKEAEVKKWYNEDLNDSQKQAVKYSLGARDFHLIHGPPGTGKTTTAIEVIEQAISSGNQVLATAASNMAVDNILEFLLEQGVKAVRVGHPARVTPQLKEHTLDHLVQQNNRYQQSEKLRDQAFELKEAQDEYTHPSGRYRRGMSDEKIQKLAKAGNSSRGVPADKINEMAQWLDIQDEINTLFERADNLRDEAVNEVLDNMQVVCTTNSTAGSDLMENRIFDLVIIDEATQATEPSCLIPLTHGLKVVMAGDHRQLPPTVKNLKAAKEGLENTLFERLAENYPEIKRMLNMQYRMNEKIMRFSSREFYGGDLRAHEGVSDHTLSDLEVDINAINNRLMAILDPHEPVVFVDTADRNAGERSPKGSTSKENPEEALLVKQMVDNLLYAGMGPEGIAVISPYKDQVDLLDRKFDEEELEIKTVDGFQGREKEAVIISLTRSNKENSIGFLEDVRRLNVSLTRAKRKLIVVGDSSTVSAHETYRNFLNYVQDNGKIVAV